MTDEQPDVPEVQPDVAGGGDLGSDKSSGRSTFLGGEGEVPVSRMGESSEDRDPGLDGDQGEEGPSEIQAWLAGAERVMLSWWHDPRTALKYSVAVMRLLKSSTKEEILAIEPADVPPITEREVGWT